MLLGLYGLGLFLFFSFLFGMPVFLIPIVK